MQYKCWTSKCLVLAHYLGQSHGTVLDHAGRGNYLFDLTFVFLHPFMWNWLKLALTVQRIEDPTLFQSSTVGELVYTDTPVAILHPKGSEAVGEHPKAFLFFIIVAKTCRYH